MPLTQEERQRLTAVFDELMEARADTADAVEDVIEAAEERQEAVAELGDGDATEAEVTDAVEAAVDEVEAEAELAESIAEEVVAEEAAAAVTGEIIEEHREEAAAEEAAEVADELPGGAGEIVEAVAAPPTVDAGPELELAGASVGVVTDEPPVMAHPYYRPWKWGPFGRRQP